jgi:hypothetical protein
MNFARIALISLLFQVGASTQNPTASIEGVVVRADSNEPLSSVKVVLNTAASQVVVTSSDGKFAFTNLRPGRHLLSATADGFVPTDYGKRGPNGDFAELVLTPDQRMTGVRLFMTPSGSISGRILDGRGEPAVRAQVRAERLSYHTGVPTLVTAQAVLTNDLGEYRLFWLPPGPYIISATLTDPKAPVLPVLIAPGHMTVNHLRNSLTPLAAPGPLSGISVTSRVNEGGISIEEASLPVYYPGTGDARTASRVDVRAGANTAGIDVIAAPVRVHRVRGWVIDGSNGARIAGVTVGLIPKSSDGRVESQPVPAIVTPGGFEFAGIPPGSYFLFAQSAMHPGGQSLDLNGGRHAGGISIEVGNSDLENVTIVARPSYILSGRVRLDGQPPASADTGGRAAQLVLRADGRAGTPFETTANIARDGTFSIPVVLAGEFQVFLRNLGELGYARSIRLGPSDGLYERISMNGPPQVPLEIVINTNPGTLQGTVLNERREPVFNARVAVVPEARYRGRPDLYFSAKTDGSGKFTLRGMAPGNYAVFAWEDVENGAWYDPEFLRIYETRGRTVSFVEGSTETVELIVIPYR